MPFSKVAPSDVDPGFRRRVNLYMAKAVLVLGIPVPEIEYWRPDPKGNITEHPEKRIAFECAGRVYLTIDIPERHLRRIVFHEARHVWQGINGMTDRDYLQYRQEYEKDAQDFSWEMERNENRIN